MVTNNCANITGAGIVKHNATGGFTPVTPVQYNLLIGGADNSMTSVAPTAASGVPFVSQGASANSICGTMSVAGGGTGAVSLTGVLTGNGTGAITANPVTQYGVLFAGASNAVSSTSAATNGQTIIGATGAAPTAASVAIDGSASSTVGANALTIHSGTTSAAIASDWSDDFLGKNQGGWNSSVVTTGTLTCTGASSTSHPGIWSLNTGAGTSGSLTLSKGSFILGYGEVTVTWIFAVSAVSTSAQRYSLRIGICDLAIANGGWLYYSDNNNSGKFQYNTLAGGNYTIVQGNAALTGVFPTFQVARFVINADGTSWDFLTGPTVSALTSMGTITTNIPKNVPLTAQVQMYKSGGTTSRSLYIDYCGVNTRLTTAR